MKKRSLIIMILISILFFSTLKVLADNNAVTGSNTREFEWCGYNDTTGYTGLVKVVGIVILVINVLRIAVVVGLIGYTIYEAIKVVFKPDEKKNFSKHVINRFIIAVLVFFIPTLTRILLNKIYDIDTSKGNNSEIITKSGTCDENSGLGLCWCYGNEYYDSIFVIEKGGN